MILIFKEISSSTYGLKVKKRPPIPKAERSIEKIEVPGRHGFLTVDNGNFKGISIPVEFLFTGQDVATTARQIKQWLIGSGNLSFSDDPSVYYKASVFNAFDIESAIKNFGEFQVIFDCQPFAYEINSGIIMLEQAVTIYNTGYESEPYIKVTGSGNITLNINSKNIILTNVVDYIEIDSEMMNCFKGAQNCNNQMQGEFPILVTGNNEISWTGTVIKVEITPRWRWL